MIAVKGLWECTWTQKFDLEGWREFKFKKYMKNNYVQSKYILVYWFLTADLR